MQKPQIKIVFTNERLITPSGLTIVGGMLGKSSFVKQCNRIPVDKKRSEPQIKDGDILLTYIGLLCQGKTEFEAVKEMQDPSSPKKVETHRIASSEELVNENVILFLNKKSNWISEQNLRQTRRSPQSIMDIYGQGLQRRMAHVLPERLCDFYYGIV